MIDFKTPQQEHLFDTVISGLGRLGYQGELLQKSYRFQDWFVPGNPERVADAAAFGESPASYNSACFAVVVANGKSGWELVRDYRSLGAPRAFEVHPDKILHWRVSSDPNSKSKPIVIRAENAEEAFRANDSLWRPESVLRAKNIGPTEPQQHDFIDIGLIPALEHHIQYKLDPLIRKILFGATSEYSKKHGRMPDPDALFRLLFRALAGKVMHDRGIRRFDTVGGLPDPEDVLTTVAAYYADRQPVIADLETRRFVVDDLWKGFSFANLSVEVLAFIWEHTLVDDEARIRLGIHATPPSIARYIVRRLPIEDIPWDQRRIVEPCCGSGTFLVAALQRLRDLVSPRRMTLAERHDYLKSMLSGFDIETFGLEVARYCLMLADFPNPNGWALELEDVFASPGESPKFHTAIQRAGVVLCNPPFEPFPLETRPRYQLRSVQKPVELLGRVLDHLPASGLVGFVLPQQFLSGIWYRDLRERVAKRYEEVEFVSLPDDVFTEAEHETALLIARRPRAESGDTKVFHRKVEDGGWPLFRGAQLVSREDFGVKNVSEAVSTFAIPDLQHLWDSLARCPRLTDATGIIQRGIEWNIPLTEENRPLLISNKPQPGFARGLASAPRGGFLSFQCPPVSYLCVNQEYQLYKAFDLPWDRPKVVMNAKRKSRSPWRLAAFADYSGLVCYQTYTCLWPVPPWTATTLAAVLNAPLANAYIAAHEPTRDITLETIRSIPVPRLSQDLADQIEVLVPEYLDALSRTELEGAASGRTADRVLREIDAVVLKGYRLPPRLERELLDYFNGYGDRRPAPFKFADYFPPDFEPCIPLSEYLSEAFKRSTAGAWRARRRTPDEEILKALAAAVEAYRE